MLTHGLRVAPLRLHLRRVQPQQYCALNQLALLPRQSRLAAAFACARLHTPLRASGVRRKARRAVAARATANMSNYEAELQKGYEAVELASRLCEVRIRLQTQSRL
jgi:hypothetical protein